LLSWPFIQSSAPANAATLPLLLQVRVAQINGLSPDRSVIDIAWNWQLG